MTALTWNLFHGRSVPPAGHELAAAYAELLAGFAWDVALLQEVPPWWVAGLARASGAQGHTALTSRNSLAPLRRALAGRWPDVMKSAGGGANAILVRGQAGDQPILVRGQAGEHLRMRLRVRPERRVAQAARLAGGAVAVNFHASARVPLAESELARLWRWGIGLAGGGPLLLGGDLNLRAPLATPAGAVHAAARDVDHLFACGFGRVLDAGTHERRIALDGRPVELSDHPPLWAKLAAP